MADDSKMKEIYLERYSRDKEDARSFYARRFIEWMIKRRIFPRNREAKILDLGCGTGLTYFALKRMGYKNVTGVDREKFFPEVVVADLEKGMKNIKDNTFDVILARDVIEHVANGDQFFKETYRVLKPKGRMIVETVATEKAYLGEFYDGYDHRNPYTRIKLAEGFRLFGFKRIRVRLFRPIPYIWRYTLKSFDYVWGIRKRLILGWGEK